MPQGSTGFAPFQTSVDVKVTVPPLFSLILAVMEDQEGVTDLPQSAVYITLTMMSLVVCSCGLGRSLTATAKGPWKTTAFIIVIESETRGRAVQIMRSRGTYAAIAAM